MAHTCRNCGGSGKVTCPRCGGDGKIQGETCYYCQGSGTVECKAWKIKQLEPGCVLTKEHLLKHCSDIKEIFVSAELVKLSA